jgi:hypothetical protein
LVEDIPTKNNTDKSADKTVETNYEGGTCYFSSAQDPSQHTSLYGFSDIFALAMFQLSAPTLLAYSGTYAKNADMKIENILPFAFLFGIKGPKMQQRVKVSLELCIQVYASFPGAIYGRANYSGDESHLQQANVIQDWGNDVQVNY